VIISAEFVTSAAGARDFPRDRLPEVALVGRSNVGKSSLINALVRRKLARTSAAPGKTRLANFYRVQRESERALYLVDLPGYGYAKVPAAVKAKWEGLLARYLQEREALVGMVLIMDARHPLTPLDWQMLNWFTPTGKQVHILLSKADKLSNSEKTLTLRRVEQELAALGNVTVQLFSSLSRLGVEEAAKVVEGWLAPVPQAAEQAAE